MQLGITGHHQRLVSLSDLQRSKSNALLFLTFASKMCRQLPHARCFAQPIVPVKNITALAAMLAIVHILTPRDIPYV